MRKGWKKSKGDIYKRHIRGLKLSAYQWEPKETIGFTAVVSGGHVFLQISLQTSLDDAMEWAESMADAHQAFLNRMKYQRAGK